MTFPPAIGNIRRMKRGLILMTFVAAAASRAATAWVGYEGGIGQYDERGDLVRRWEGYRRPVSLCYDAASGRLWFIDAYDYTLVCLDVASGTEVFRIKNAAHASSLAGGNLKVYLLEKKPVEPALALDPGDGSAWLADFYGHELARYDATGKEIFRGAGFHEPFAVAPLGDGRAWVSASIRTLSLVGADGAEVKNQTGVNEARALAYDAVAGLVWVADYRNNRVLAMTADATLKKKISGIELPNALVAASGVAWVATQYEGIKKITAAEEKVAAAITTSENAAALAPDGAGGVWAAFPDAGAVIRYDGDGNVVTKIERLPRPAAVAAE